MNMSIWMDGIKFNNYPELTKNEECDVLIIGGGITGVCTAYYLQNYNLKTILVESNTLAHATTAKSTGKLTYLQDTILNKIQDVYNEETVLKYINSQKEAISLALNLIKENKIDCNLEKTESYIFAKRRNNIKEIDKTYNMLNKLNIKVTTKKNIPLKTKCYKAISVSDTYVFHPVKFVLKLADKIKNGTIYEHTRITNIKRKNNYWHAYFKNGTIKSKIVVIACHYPFFIKPYFFPFKTSIEKSFLVASKIDKPQQFSAINVDPDVESFRYHRDIDNYLIMVSYSDDLHKGKDNLVFKDKIISRMNQKYAQQVKYCWSNHDIMTVDHMPLVGKIQNNFYLATGYNTWGMTNGILAGKIISDLITEQKNEYASLFNPLRPLKNIPNLINNNCKNVYSFMCTKLLKNKNFYRNDVKIIKENGVWIGIYTDENKVEHKVLNVCPHMKCNLSFNYQDKTWDCPCHGSRFDIEGNVIYGPTNYDIKINKKS